MQPVAQAQGVMTDESRNGDPNDRNEPASSNELPLRSIRGDDDYGDSIVSRSVGDSANSLSTGSPDPVAAPQPPAPSRGRSRRVRVEPEEQTAQDAPQTPLASAAPEAPVSDDEEPVDNEATQTRAGAATPPPAPLNPVEAEVVRQRLDAVAARYRAVNLEPDPVRRAALVQELSGESEATYERITTQEERTSFDAAWREGFVARACEAFGLNFIQEAALPQTLQARVQHVVNYCSTYAFDFILQNLSIMLFTGVPKDMIASRFGVLVRQIDEWELDLKAYNAARVASLRKGDSLDSHMGWHIAFFETRAKFGMQMALAPNATPEAKRTGMHIAERAHTNMIKYEEMGGLYMGAPLLVTKKITHVEEEDYIKDSRELTTNIKGVMSMIPTYSVPGDGAVANVMGDDRVRIKK